VRPRQAASATRRRSTPPRIRGHPLPRRPCRAAAPCGRVKRRTPPRRHDDRHHPHRQRAGARSMDGSVLATGTARVTPTSASTGPRSRRLRCALGTRTESVHTAREPGVVPPAVAGRRRPSVSALVRERPRPRAAGQRGCTARAGMGRRSGRALPPPDPSRPLPPPPAPSRPRRSANEVPYCGTGFAVCTPIGTPSALSGPARTRSGPRASPTRPARSSAGIEGS
jgi:hypothetical protein